MSTQQADVESGNDARESGNDASNSNSKESSKNRDKKLVFFVGLLAFLLGGGIIAGVWWYLDSRDDDSPSPANTVPKSTPVPITSTPISSPTFRPTAPPTSKPTPTFAPTTEEEGMLQKLFDEHGPLWDDAAAWLFNTDMYQPQNDAELVERYALAVMFYRTRGGNLWNLKQGWLSSNSVCNGWHGISCNGSGEVTEIELVDNSLVGALPTEIGILTALTSITIMASYELTGSLPSEIAYLTALENLTMRNNYLGGEIPTEVAMLTRLTTLDLENNILTGSLPTGIPLLTNLRQLSAGGNELKGGIPNISTLTNLRILELDRNQLTNFLPELITLTNLQKLDLKTNKLTGAVPELPNSIQDCDLEWNSFSNVDNGVEIGCIL